MPVFLNDPATVVDSRPVAGILPSDWFHLVEPIEGFLGVTRKLVCVWDEGSSSLEKIPLGIFERVPDLRKVFTTDYEGIQRLSIGLELGLHRGLCQPKGGVPPNYPLEHVFLFCLPERETLIPLLALVEFRLLHTRWILENPPITVGMNVIVKHGKWKGMRGVIQGGKENASFVKFHEDPRPRLIFDFLLSHENEPPIDEESWLVTRDECLSKRVSRISKVLEVYNRHAKTPHSCHS